MPEVKVVSTLETILANLEASLNKSVDDYVFATQIRAKDLLARGVSPEEVNRILLEDIKNNTGEFKQLTGTLGAQIDKALSQTSLDTANEAVRDLADRFRWDWEPSVVEHCDTCQEYNGQIKTYDEWTALGLPGAGLTDCTYWCRCTLTPV